MARTTVANILKEQGIPPSGERPMSWRTFLRAHLDAILGADRRTSAFWTLRRWVTSHAVCAIKLDSERIPSMVSPLRPHQQVVSQVGPQLADVVRPELLGRHVFPPPALPCPGLPSAGRVAATDSREGRRFWTQRRQSRNCRVTLTTKERVSRNSAPRWEVSRWSL